MKKNLISILLVLCLAASAVMYFVGKKSSHLSELKDFWWMPLPLAGILLLLLGKKSSNR